MIGIIGAMDEEVEQIVAVMDIKKEETKACMTFKAGILAGKDVVIVRSGIGKLMLLYVHRFLLTILALIMLSIQVLPVL